MHNYMKEHLLSPRQLQVLALAAMGNEAPEIGKQLGITKATVRATSVVAREKVDAPTLGTALVLAVRQGQLNLESLIPKNYNFDRFETLTPKQREVLDVFFSHDGYITMRGVASELTYSVDNIKKHLRNIYNVLGARNRTQLLVLCLAAKKKNYFNFP
jgi:DNA-binding NarL/FixJ family response regulator